MPKNSILAIGILVAISAVAGGVYVASGKSPIQIPGVGLSQLANQDSSRDSSNKEGGLAQGISQTMSFVELMKLGENYTCTFSDASEDASVTGTVFVAGKENKFRTDYNTDVSVELSSGGQYGGKNGMQTQERIKQTGSMITDGEYTYIWDNSSKQGIKMKFTQQDQADLEESMKDLEGYESVQSKNDGSGFDQTAEMNYDCKRWSVDSSVFNPPSDIVFTDFEEQMNQFQGIMDSYDSYQE